jgi:hypothetical protein
MIMAVSSEHLSSGDIASSSSSSSQQHPPNPIEPIPGTALFDSYTYHSPLPPHPAEDGDVHRGWMMGIDEAGRGREWRILSLLVQHGNESWIDL